MPFQSECQKFIHQTPVKEYYRLQLRIREKKWTQGQATFAMINLRQEYTRLSKGHKIAVFGIPDEEGKGLLRVGIHFHKNYVKIWASQLPPSHFSSKPPYLVWYIRPTPGEPRRTINSFCTSHT